MYARLPDNLTDASMKANARKAVMSEADNALMTLEHASDSELRATRRQHHQGRQDALNQPSRDRGSAEPG